MKLISAFVLMLGCVFPMTAQPGGDRFRWELQAPWGIEHRQTINDTIKLMSMNPMDPNAIRLAPFKMFDNLYFIGFKNVCAFVVSTSAGLVLLDAGFPNTVDALLDNMREQGLKPENIKYILVSHSHIDHFGGAGRIKELTGARIAMSDEDWKAVQDQQEAAKQSGRDLGLPLTRDIVKGEGDTLTVGDTDFKFYFTPGHSPGALSAEFQVFDRGKGYRAISPGGLGMQFSSEWTTAYLRSLEHIRALGPWDVLIGNHPFYLVPEIEDARRQLVNRGNGPNPFISGPTNINEWLDGAIRVTKTRLEADADEKKR